MRYTCILLCGSCLALMACTEASDAPLAPQHALEAQSDASVHSAARSNIWRLSGGGHIREGEWDISFGGYLTALTGTGDAEIPGHGRFVVQFHKVSNEAVAGGMFRAASIGSVNFVLPGDPGLCVAAGFFGLPGMFDGEPGWSLTFRSSDGGNGRSTRAPDTARFSLYGPDGELVYDSAEGAGGDFPEESNCAGGRRANLDAGNLRIAVPN